MIMRSEYHIKVLDELKEGMVVTLRNGAKYLVIESVVQAGQSLGKGLVGVSPHFKNSYILTEFKNDLTHMDKHDEDIVLVCNPVSSWRAIASLSNKTTSGIIIYERG